MGGLGKAYNLYCLIKQNVGKQRADIKGAHELIDVRMLKSLIKVFLQHALFCHVYNRSLYIISFKAEMAEE